MNRTIVEILSPEQWLESISNTSRMTPYMPEKMLDSFEKTLKGYTAEVPPTAMPVAVPPTGAAAVPPSCSTVLCVRGDMRWLCAVSFLHVPSMLCTAPYRAVLFVLCCNLLCALCCAVYPLFQKLDE